MGANNAVQNWLSLRFRALLSGAKDGTPPWLDAVARGDEPGLYLPSDAPWVVHRDFGTLVGGIRALLMQALHPGPLSGVADHSRYQSDPLGRLAGTIRWLTVTTFGGAGSVAQEGNRVNRLHDRVSGTYTAGSGETRDYRAADADLLTWVHVAFMESFLVAHELYARAPIPAGDAPTGADNYINQWARSVEPLGLSEVPRSRAEMETFIDDQLARGELCVTTETLSIVSFLRTPQLPLAARPVYRLLFAAAVASIRPRFRQMLGLRSAPMWLIQPTTRTLLSVLRTAIGPESPIEDAARRRLERIGVL